MLILNSYKSIFLDTNILLHGTFEDLDNDKYIIVRDALDKLFTNGCNLFISSQILREFFAISTNAKIFQNPLTIEEAVQKLQEFQDNFIVLYDTNSSLTILKKMLLKYKIERQKIHDANIAATIISNNLDGLFTFNTKDFKIFSEIKLFET